MQLKSLALLVLHALLLLAFSAEARAETFDVPAQHQTIQSALDAASDGDVVRIAPGTYRGRGNFDLNVQGKAIRIEAADPKRRPVLNGENKSRLFLFNHGESRDSVLSGLEFRNGIANQFGGAVRLDGPTSPTFENCAFTGNRIGTGSDTDAPYGGAVHCGWSATPLFRDCQFTNNSARTAGGAVGCYQASPEFEGCVFTNNTALLVSYGISTGCGGAVYAETSSSPSFRDCLFEGNKSDRGGAIAVEWTGNLKLDRCRILDNEALEIGGGIYAKDSEIEITNCLIAANRCPAAESDGAGVALVLTGGTITNCTIADNEAQRSGGGILCANASHPRITSCVIRGNTPDQIGLVLPENSEVVRFCNVEGGFPGERNNDVTPLFTNPASKDYSLKNGSPCVDAGAQDGGPADDLIGRSRPQGRAVDMGCYESEHLANAVPEFTSLAITPADWSPVSTKVQIHCTAVDPDSSIRSYGVDFGDGSAIATSTTGVFQHIYRHAGQYQIRCLVRDENGVEVTSAPQTYEVTGGTIPGGYRHLQAAIDAAAPGSEIVLPDGVYGGPGNRNLDLSEKNVRIRSEKGPDACIIDCESAGRAVDFTGWSGTGIALEGLTIVNGLVGSEDGGGGAIRCRAGSPTFKNLKLINNAGSHWQATGGAVLVEAGAPTFVDCVFAENQSRQGGAVRITGINVQPEFDHCTFAGNTGSYTGGAVEITYGASPHFSHCLFDGNSAEVFGGAIRDVSGGTSRFESCVFTANESGAGGSVFSIDGTTSLWEKARMELVNCVALDNQVTGEACASWFYRGGFASVQRADLVLTHCTVSRNTTTSDGSVIFAFAMAGVDARNCILWGNSPPAGAVAQDSSSSVNFSYCDVQGGATGTRNIDANPSLRSRTDSRLRANSPCVDAANPLYECPVDIAGTARPVGDAPDMGAYEGEVVGEVGSANAATTSASRDEHDPTPALPTAEEVRSLLLVNRRWADADPGDSAVYRCVAETATGGQVEFQFTCEFVGRDGKATKFDVETIWMQAGKEAARTKDLVGGGDLIPAGTQATTTPGEAEEVNAGGKTYEADLAVHRIYDPAAKILTVRREWTAGATIGQLVKAEVEVSGGRDYELRIELVKSGK